MEMIKKIKRIVKTIVFIVILSSFCIIMFANTKANKKAKENEFNIVTSINPIFVMASNITNGVEDISVTSVTGKLQGCPHDYQLTPKNMSDITESDVFFINGLGMESYLEDLLEESASYKLVNLNESIEHHDEEEEHHDEEEEHHDEEEEHHDDEEEHHHHHEASHIWLDLSIYKNDLKLMTDTLCEMNKANAEKFRANEKDYLNRLKEVEEGLKEIEFLKGTDTVIFHGSSENLLGSLGVNILGEVDIESEAGVSANEVKETIELIKEKNIKYVVTDPTYNQNVVKQIASETNVKVCEVNPLVNNYEGYLLDSYIIGMTENIESLKKVK